MVGVAELVATGEFLKTIGEREAGDAGSLTVGVEGLEVDGEGITGEIVPLMLRMRVISHPWGQEFIENWKSFVTCLS